MQIEAKERLARSQAERLAQLTALQREAAALRENLTNARGEADTWQRKAAAVPELSSEIAALNAQVSLIWQTLH